MDEFFSESNILNFTLMIIKTDDLGLYPSGRISYILYRLAKSHYKIESTGLYKRKKEIVVNYLLLCGHL